MCAICREGTRVTIVPSVYPCDVSVPHSCLQLDSNISNLSLYYTVLQCLVLLSSKNLLWNYLYWCTVLSLPEKTTNKIKLSCNEKHYPEKFKVYPHIKDCFSRIIILKIRKVLIVFVLRNAHCIIFVYWNLFIDVLFSFIQMFFCFRITLTKSIEQLF